MPPRNTASKAKAEASTGPAKSAPSRKRKATTDPEHGDEKPAKRSRSSTSKEGSKNNKNLKQTEISTASADQLEQPILINRAPVLELWGACVAHHTHPDLSWNLCLSIGSSISTITAISKGRSIGTIAPPDDAKDDSKKKRSGEDLPVIKVMGFPMIIKGDSVIVKGKPKTTREANLQRKFGEDGYVKVKEAMEAALHAWDGDKEQLDGKAFHMYEKFRPNVAKGQKGWGRKGELHLSKIEDAVRRR